MKKVFAYIENANNLKFLLLFALLFRLVLIPNPSFEADIAFWKSWGLAVRDFGIVKGLPLTNFNYPTPFAYVLSLMATIYGWFADPHNFNEYWSNVNILFLAISKAPSILADFGIFAVFLWIGKHAKKIGFPTFPYIFFVFLALLYILNPLSFFDGALWGQVDSVGVLLFLIANCFVLSKKPLLGGVIYMISMMTKLQNMIYGPIFFVFVWQYLGFEGLLQAVGGALGAFLATNFEFIRARNMARVASDLTGNYDYFPWLSLNAYNVWWIVAGGHGMKISDKIAGIGIANAKTVGLYMFSATYLLSVFIMVSQTLTKLWRTKSGVKITINSDPIEERSLVFRYLSALIVAAAGFFLFQTESHDRYAFPICVFLLLWAPYFFAIVNPKNLEHIIDSKILKQFLIGYGIFCTVFFYNIHNAMIQNYPKNGIPFLNPLNTTTMTIGASFIQIGLFFWFLYILRRHIPAFAWFIWIGSFVLLLTIKNMPLITKRPVAITQFTPIISITGYGQRQVDMPVMASFGFAKWGFLSDQYFFYRHGLGTHAVSQEVFDINKKFSKLTTDYGVDTNGGPQGSVQFAVYGDGKKLFASDIVRRYDPPHHVVVNVTGVKTLELIVNDGGNGITDDHADWLNTYLIP